MLDIFDQSVDDLVNEKIGSVIAKKDLQAERSEKKKTDEDVYEDFLFDRYHPFIGLLIDEAEKFEKTGEAFIVRNRITVLKETNSHAFELYYNNGETWRQSGEALVWKFLKERFPGLYTPGMKFGCKGEKLLLDDNPGHFEWVREVYRKRAEERKKEVQ